MKEILKHFFFLRRKGDGGRGEKEENERGKVFARIFTEREREREILIIFLRHLFPAPPFVHWKNSLMFGR